MKILLDHHEPFSLAHGGFQVQIIETAKALRESGLEVEFLRWWDAEQKGDILHFFGLPPLHTVERAQGKGMPVVITHLLTNTCNRPPWKLAVQASATQALLRIGPAQGLCAKMGWLSLRKADAVVVGLRAEARIMQQVWGVAEGRVHVAPLGVDIAFSPLVKSTDEERGSLINVGTIAARKRQCELARLALEAKTPVLFVGKPLSEKDPYWGEFRGLCDGKIVRYHPHVSAPNELAELYRKAVGYVHYSESENWCLTAHEAAACGLPLLLPDQPWARECFGKDACYFGNGENHAAQLRDFQEKGPSLQKSKAPPFRWKDTSQKLIEVYSAILPGK